MCKIDHIEYYCSRNHLVDLQDRKPQRLFSKSMILESIHFIYQGVTFVAVSNITTKDCQNPFNFVVNMCARHLHFTEGLQTHYIVYQHTFSLDSERYLHVFLPDSSSSRRTLCAVNSPQPVRNYESRSGSTSPSRI
ncbi:hypothetical protein KSF78_0009731 [Schistosoma japonicum]|nr:hypothetical protein KSF78_0009731 [Schistosoma japonicum]KAH8848917.1 hypothetical protein KSF78_0009731 [Schistosoma japonicum]KAH8848918.1 hypothetical protein KSF78_0009731 [Schistosoma japonicum]KAH8848919.1 hypothetical protein KSF78_0009731 [Schistosoma japonicum]KAH8848920.1 hypothetical protein KSF78_0009731 [Schistosoma japonicum]